MEGFLSISRGVFVVFLSGMLCEMVRCKSVMCSLKEECFLYFLGVVDDAATTHTQGSEMAWHPRLADCLTVLNVQVTPQQQRKL
jgi:hypothetical protein